jgi:hypothetical protein
VCGAFRPPTESTEAEKWTLELRPA